MLCLATCKPWRRTAAGSWKVGCSCSFLKGSPVVVTWSVNLKQSGFLPFWLFELGVTSSKHPLSCFYHHPLVSFCVKIILLEWLCVFCFWGHRWSPIYCISWCSVEIVKSMLREKMQHLWKFACRIHSLTIDRVLPGYLEDICQGSAKNNILLLWSLSDAYWDSSCCMG